MCSLKMDHTNTLDCGRGGLRDWIWSTWKNAYWLTNLMQSYTYWCFGDAQELLEQDLEKHCHVKAHLKEIKVFLLLSLKCILLVVVVVVLIEMKVMKKLQRWRFFEQKTK